MAWASLEMVLRVGTALELLKRNCFERSDEADDAPDEVRRRKGARAGRRWAWSDLGWGGVEGESWIKIEGSGRAAAGEEMRPDGRRDVVGVAAAGEGSAAADDEWVAVDGHDAWPLVDLPDLPTDTAGDWVRPPVRGSPTSFCLPAESSIVKGLMFERYFPGGRGGRIDVTGRGGGVLVWSVSPGGWRQNLKKIENDSEKAGTNQHALPRQWKDQL
jgi:hypothetical protein